MIMAALGVKGKVAPLNIADLQGELGEYSNDGAKTLSKIKDFLANKQLPKEKLEGQRPDEGGRGKAGFSLSLQLNKQKEEFLAAGGSFAEYRLNDIFDIQKGKRLTRAEMIPGIVNFLGAISTNNGIREKISVPSTWKPNCITVNYNGSVGCSFYQEEPFWASDDVNICYARGWEMNRERALYFCTALFKRSQGFSYTQKWTIEHSRDNKAVWNRVKQEKVWLPLNEKNEPDWAFMETLIRAESRLVISGITAWKDKHIQKTKELIDG